MVEKVLDWVRDHPLPDGRLIPVCVWGSAGTGKTQLIRSYCAKRDISFRGFHPAHSTSGADLVGRQYIDKALERTVYARPLWLPSEKDPISWNKRGLLFVDEINRAPLEVLQGLMEPIGEGTIDQSGWKLPKDWGFVCAANPPREGYQAKELDDSLMDRMLHIPMGFDAIRWTAWANATKVPADLVDFTARFPEMMAETDLTLPKEITIKTTPRSMEYLARLYEPGMDMELLRLLAEGLIGSNPAEAFIDHLRNSDRPVSSQEIVTGRFKEKLNAHIAGHREDLIKASQVLLLATLAGNKFREGTDDPVATHVASYIEMLGNERYQLFWPELLRQAPHWEAPLTRALNG